MRAFRRAQRLVSGRPRIVVREGVIDQKRLKELRFTPTTCWKPCAKDIFELRRSPALETNGSVSVRTLRQTAPPTAHRLKPPSKTAQPSRPY
ncbi:MAG: YetF domain-containing protein [Ruthenibacterium sp.]